MLGSNILTYTPIASGLQRPPSASYPEHANGYRAGWILSAAEADSSVLNPYPHLNGFETHDPHEPRALVSSVLQRVARDENCESRGKVRKGGRRSLATTRCLVSLEPLSLAESWATVLTREEFSRQGGGRSIKAGRSYISGKGDEEEMVDQ